LKLQLIGGKGPFWKSNNIQQIKPLTFNKPSAFYKPKYTAANKSSVTDLRSTIYWAPNIITDGNGKAKINFFTTDRKGTYTLTINGADMNGNVGSFSTKIMVK